MKRRLFLKLFSVLPTVLGNFNLDGNVVTLDTIFDVDSNVDVIFAPHIGFVGRYGSAASHFSPPPPL